MKHSLIGLLCAGIITAATGVAQAESFKLVTIGHGYWAAPLYVAQHANLFKKHGLEPEVTTVKGGSLALQAVLSKNTDVALLSYEHIVKAASKGQRVVAIFRMVDRNILNIVGSNDLASGSEGLSVAERIKRLGGKRVGVSSAGASSDKMLTVLGNKYGLDLGSTQKVFLGGSPGAYVAAFKNDLVDVAFVVEPAGSMVRQEGDGKNYVDIMGGEEPAYDDLIFMVVSTHPDTVGAKPDLLKKVAAAFQDSLDIIKKQPERAKELLKQEYPDMNPALNEGVFEAMEPVWTDDGRMTAAAGRRVIDYLAQGDRSVEKIEIETTFTNEFLPR